MPFLAVYCSVRPTTQKNGILMLGSCLLREIFRMIANSFCAGKISDKWYTASAVVILIPLDSYCFIHAMQKKQQIRNSTAEFLIFAMQGDAEGIEVRIEDDTVWLTQQMLAELYGTTKQNISLHILNIYEEEELSRESTVKDFLTVRNEGNRKVNRRLEYYNLDITIAVGYRVNSKRATQFRQWATAVLRDFAIRGYVLDRKRMENGKFLGQDYFEHLLAEIREIRLSERRFYQKITDIYATSMDWHPVFIRDQSFQLICKLYEEVSCI